MNIHQKMVIFFEKIMKRYFKTVMLSLKIDENILKFNFLMGRGMVLDMLTVYANTLMWSFIDIKNNEVSQHIYANS